MSSPQRMRMFGFFAPCAKELAVERPSATRRSAARSSFGFHNLIVLSLFRPRLLFSFSKMRSSMKEEVSFCRWKNGRPIVFHADDGPAFVLGFIERLVEFADRRLPIVGPLAFGIGVMNETHETWA